VILQSNIDTALNNIIEKAVDFHGHLGPFLVIGVRIGLIGLRELGLKKSTETPHVTALLEYSVPFSDTVKLFVMAKKVVPLPTKGRKL